MGNSLGCARWRPIPPGPKTLQLATPGAGRARRRSPRPGLGHGAGRPLGPAPLRRATGSFWAAPIGEHACRGRLVRALVSGSSPPGLWLRALAPGRGPGGIRVSPVLDGPLILLARPVGDDVSHGLIRTFLRRILTAKAPYLRGYRVSTNR